MLGAVRHKGFIPWDDDIDIGMPRKDYEKFINEGPKFLNNQYFIQTFDTDDEYLMGYAKIRDCKTTFIETSVKDRNINHGVYIDIFPLDGISSSIFLEKVRIAFLKLYQFKIGSYFYRANPQKTKLKTKIVSNILTYHKSSKEVLIKISSLAKKYNFNESFVVGNYFGIWGEKEFYPREYLGKGVILKFEHLEVNAPEKYDLYLKHVYGDYMQLPPIEKQQSHHDIEILDLNKSYLYYLTNVSDK